MAKTIFADGDKALGIPGTKVPSSFLNPINNHYHTGRDTDGEGALPYAVAGGTADAIVLTLSPALPAYIAGMPIRFKAAADNTGAVTLNINTLGVVAVKKNVNDALIAGDIKNGAIVEVVYDGTNFQLRGVSVLNADKLLADGAYRTAALAAAANGVPLRKAAAPYALPDAELAMTGEANATHATSASIDLGSVKNGDRIFVSISGDVSLTSANPCFVKISGTKSAGTSTGKFLNNHDALDVMVSNSVAAVFAGKPATSAIWEVTGDGTLTLNAAFSSGGAGVTVNNVQISAFFLKRQ